MAESTLTLTREDLARAVIRHWKGDDVARSGTAVDDFDDGTVDVYPVDSLTYATGTLSISTLSDGTCLATIAGGTLPWWVNIDAFNNPGNGFTAYVTVDSVDYGVISNGSAGGTGFSFRQFGNPAPAANPTTWELRFVQNAYSDSYTMGSLVRFSDAVPSWMTTALNSGYSLRLMIGPNEYTLQRVYAAGGSAGDYSAGILPSVTFSAQAFEVTRLGDGPIGGSFLSAAEERIVDDCVKSGYRRFLFPPVLPGETSPYQWSFLMPRGALVFDAPYVTGTIEATAGTVTLSDGVWPAWAEYGELIIDRQNYPVLSRTDGTELVLEGSVDADAGTTFQLIRTRYVLPDAWGSMIGPLAYVPTGDWCAPPVEQIGEMDWRARRTHGRQTGVPVAYAVVPVAPKEDLVGQRWELCIWPASDQMRTVSYQYALLPDAMLESDSLHYGGAVHSETLLEACLFAWEEMLEGISNGVHASAFMRALATSVNYDRLQSTPDNLGLNLDSSDPYENMGGGSELGRHSLHCGGLIINLHV